MQMEFPCGNRCVTQFVGFALDAQAHARASRAKPESMARSAHAGIESEAQDNAVEEAVEGAR